MEDLRERIVQAIKTCYDPEIPVDVYELGLIYKIDISDEGSVHVTMTVTAPACPVADILPVQVQERIETVEGVKDAKVDLVWDPPWHPGLMSEAAKLELGF
ncbi:MAG: iron-sulfur cluster assembly protein [Myxococcota bacterium]